MFGTPAASTACTIRSDSAPPRASGFSVVTILPAAAAATAISAWVSLGLAMSIRSMSSRATSARQSVSVDAYPHCSANPWTSSGLRAQTACSTG
jgi:hypothetical protein